MDAGDVPATVEVYGPAVIQWGDGTKAVIRRGEKWTPPTGFDGVVDLRVPTDAELLLVRIEDAIGHAEMNEHHLDPNCQGVDFRVPPPPAVRVDLLRATIEGWRRETGKVE